MNTLNDGAQCRAVINLEGSATEEKLASIGKARKFVEAFNGVANGVEQIVARQSDEIAPRKSCPFTGEDADVLLIECGKQFVFLGEQSQKEQVGNLLNRIHRVIHATRIQNVHELIDLLAKAG